MCNKLMNPKVLFSYFIFLIIFFSFSIKAEDVIRFGVLSIAPPSRIHTKWQPFITYISQKLNKDVALVIPRGFKKMQMAATSGEVDFFYINSHVFYRLKQAGKAIAVAQMENIDGSITSTSDIFVRSDSHITSIKQLKGKSIAFISPMGAGGYLAPRAFMYSKGLHTKDQSNEVFTKNLSSSIHKVLLGEINAGTMCGVNYKLMGEKIDTGELRVIGHSSPYPENIIAARSNINPALLKTLQKIIIAMPSTQDGKKVLDLMHSMKIQRFVPYDVKSESLTKKLLKEAEF